MNRIVVPESFVRKCKRRARNAVAACAGKGYTDRYSKGKRTKAEDLELKVAGFVGEVAVCIYLGLDPDTALMWEGDSPDAGYDIRVGTTTIDVKATTAMFASRLMWPVTKMQKLATAADVFVLAKVRETDADGSRVVELSGWVTRNEFITQHWKAKGLRGIVDGTPYMDEKSLYSIDQIVQHLGHVIATKESAS